MQTMNSSLFDLYERRMVTMEEALLRSSDKDDFRRLHQGRLVGARK